MNPDKLHAAVETRQSRSARREWRPLGGIVEVPESQIDARADGLRVEPRAQLAKWARLLLCYEPGSILERTEERRRAGGGGGCALLSRWRRSAPHTGRGGGGDESLTPTRLRAQTTDKCRDALDPKTRLRGRVRVEQRH